MHILFLTRRFYPDNGGVEKHVLEISKVLIAKGHKVTVITQSIGTQSSIHGINIIRIPILSKNKSVKLHIWKWLWENKYLIKESDVIHAHDVFFWYWPFKFLFLSKKSFVTFHGYESYPITKKAIISRKVSELLADGNIIVGDFMKKWYFTKPSYVIYGGTNIPNKKLQVKNKKSAVFIGRLDYHTGILDYAKAIDIVRKEIPSFKFDVLGEGEYSKKLQKYKPRGFSKDISKYLEKNNFAFVSRYLAILEAMAHKRLVFALYDNPVKEDYLKMAPYADSIIIEKDPEELAKKVLYYLNNQKEADVLINRSYSWVKNKDWDFIVNIYLKFWR